MGGEEFFVWLLILPILFITLVAPLWALIRTFKLKDKAVKPEEVSKLADRIYSLEKQVLELTNKLEGRTPAPREAPATATAPPPPVEKPAAPPAPPVASAPPRPTAPPVAVPILSGETPAAPPAPVSPAFEAFPKMPRLKWADIEERLGTNWLNKIGIAALVIGVAFLLNYAMKQLGPAGKISIGYFLALVLLGLGIYGERRERYRVLARALLGGGWAVAYFTTYAMHNIPVVQVVKNPAVGFALLFLVAAAMVAHSLRYNSQVVTGLAYLLAYGSIAVRFVEPVDEPGMIRVGALVASAVLAASLVVIQARRKWYEFEPVAIAATYGVHWMWLTGVRGWYGAHKAFPDFNASVALCTLYWIIFTVSHYIRDEREPGKRNVLIASMLLNAAGYLAVLRYQSIHPEWRFWFLLSAGFVYLALAAYSRRVDRRLGFLLTSTLGATLLLVAIPYRYSGARLELIWLVEAEALLFVGWRLADAHLRKLGWAGLGVLATYVTFHDLSPRLVGPRHLDDPALGWLLLVIAAAYYANARLTPRLLGNEATELDSTVAKVSSPVATAFLMAAAWVALPFMWTALSWAVLCVALVESGRWLDDRILRGCGHAAAALAAIRLLVVNRQFAQPAFGTNLRVLTIGLAIAIFYYVSRRIVTSGQVAKYEGLFSEVLQPAGVRAAYTWAASGFAALLLWYELANAAVALAWGVAALVLLEAGRMLRDTPLVLQGHALFAVAFARIFFADLNADGPAGPFTSRMVSVTLLALLFYFAAATSSEEWRRMRAALYWFGTTALVALARFELPLDWVAVGWAAMTVALYFAGRKFGLRVLRYQAYLLTLGVALRCAFDNFYQKAPLWGDWNVRTITVTAASVLLYALLVESLLRRRAVAVPVAEAGDD